MKIQAGVSYITVDGRSTGILKVNPGAAINYPYYSPKLIIAYTNDGTPDDEDYNLKITEPEFAPTMIIEGAVDYESSEIDEIKRLKEENSAMRTALKQNVKFLLELQKMFTSVEHKLPRELREYLNQ